MIRTAPDRAKIPTAWPWRHACRGPDQGRSGVPAAGQGWPREGQQPGEEARRYIPSQGTHSWYWGDPSRGGGEVIELECGITVYQARSEGGRWRAVWHEAGARQQCEAATQEKLALELEKIVERPQADAPNMRRPGCDLIAHYLDLDRLPIRDGWSRKHADTQRAPARPLRRLAPRPGDIRPGGPAVPSPDDILQVTLPYWESQAARQSRIWFLEAHPIAAAGIPQSVLAHQHVGGLVGACVRCLLFPVNGGSLRFPSGDTIMVTGFVLAALAVLLPPPLGLGWRASRCSPPPATHL